jgi:tRNA pseudouridine55 synthase
VCKLGEKTTTADAEGEVVETRPVENVTMERVEEVLGRFRGDIMQIPPMYSALKHKGQPLYKLARQGIEVEREPRPVSIYRLEQVALDADRLELDIFCSRGTYIRTLVEDIGEALGCGAHISGLRRTGVGPYSDESQWFTLDALKALAAQGLPALDQALMPLETALSQVPAVQLTEDSVFYVMRGQPVQVSHAPTEGWVRLMRGENHFLGMGEILDDGRVAPRRLVNVR